MQKKLTISIDEKVYDGLHSIIGRGKISQFLENLAEKQLFPNGAEKQLPKGNAKKDAFIKLCDELAQTAKRNGMTEEILKSILDSDD